MGCWNATCNVSNLPILEGEKVVVIPLVRIMEGACSTNCCYATDNFVPFAFPIFGEYNDYGGVENATTFEENKKYLLALEFFFSRDRYDSEENNKYRPCQTYNNFDDFVNNIICCHEGCYMKQDTVSELHPDGMAEISFMMVHYDLYVKMVTEMGNRIPYNCNETYGKLLLEKFKNITNKHRENYLRYVKIEQEIPDNKKTVETAGILKEYEIENFMYDLFDRGTSLNTNKWKYFSNRMLRDNISETEILESLVKQTLFTCALSSLRKGYHCDSGCGSQSQETRAHVILANYILEHVKKLAEKDREENIDSEIPDDGVKETIFFYN